MSALSPQGVIAAVLLWITLAGCAVGSRFVIAAPTLAVVRPAKIHLETHTTINSWNPFEILRRIDGDPRVCGWIDGDSSKSQLQNAQTIH